MSTLIICGGSVIGAVVWLVRLEGRVNVTDARYDDIIGRLMRIEKKMDANHD